MGFPPTSRLRLRDLSAVPTLAMEVAGRCPFMSDVDQSPRRILAVR